MPAYTGRYYTALSRMNSNMVRRPRLNLAKYGMGPSGAMGTGTITLSTPVSYRVFQRNGSGYGDIAITATYTGTPGAVEASFNGGAWSTIQSEPTGGNISGTLTGQYQGQGTLSVRWRGNPDSVVTRTYVGVGDVLIVAGQSNACGMAETNQTYSHATLKAGKFGNNYAWAELSDPLDSNSGQVDTVSSDAGTGGSCWPRLATKWMASQSVPVAFVPCACVGTKIGTNWAIPTDHEDRTTLYGSMIYRAKQTGCKVVLWWQGESDAVDGTSEVAYNSSLDTLANTIYSDLGVKIMVAKLEMMNDAPWNFPTNRATINTAIGTAWSDNSNVIPGADFTNTDFEGIHYSAAQCNDTGDAWWTAVKTAYGWSD